MIKSFIFDLIKHNWEKKVKRLLIILFAILLISSKSFTQDQNKVKNKHSLYLVQMQNITHSTMSDQMHPRNGI